MTRQTIPVSILYSTTGSYASLGREALAGAMAAISEVNSDAGLSFRIEPRIDDPAGRAERYALLSDAAIRDHGCRHIIGTITSWSRKDVLPVVERRGALLWYGFPYEGYEASESAIYLGACPNQHLLPLFDHMLPRYGQRPFIIGSNYIWGWEINRLAREVTEAAGGQVVAERFVPLGSTEIEHLIAEIHQKQPDFVLCNLVGESATAFFDAYHARRESTPMPTIATCNVTELELENLNTPARAGHISTSIYFDDLDTPENRDFKARMALRHGQDRRLTTSFVGAYMSVSILARAIADAATDAPDAIRGIVTSRLFDTPIGQVGIDPRTQHATLRPHLAFSDRNGEFRIISSAPSAIEADPFLVHALGKPAVGTDTAAGTVLKVIK